MKKNKQGHLKIFFGYCAGVGKTFAMLEAAHQKSVQGKDVVIGYIEPHNRKETSDLIYGLEEIPRKKIIYKDRLFYELDLDIALKREPEIILVDELAHTNAPGSRHQKRYNDIEELLRAGIDVYTTVNVQHLESLHDIVESITRIKVNERIPDHIFDHADDVQLVDIEIDDLLQRLKEGKIYSQKQAERALCHFFIKDNLTALREIALRRCADRINFITANHSHPFTKEHILVCIGTSPTNQKVIRTASRMAKAFHGEFTALYVETSSSSNLSDKALIQLHSNLTLAKHLNAEIVSTYGDDIAFQIGQYAKTSGVSKLVLGRSLRTSALFHKTTIVDQLTSYAPDLEIYIIPDQTSQSQKTVIDFSQFARFSLKESLITLAILLLSTVIAFCFFFFHHNTTNIILVYLLSVCIVGMVTFYPIYNILASIISILLMNFLFIEPRYTLLMYSQDYIMVFIVMFFVSLCINSVTRKLKKENYLASIHAHNMDILLETSQHLQIINTYDDVKMTTCFELHKLLQRLIIFYPVIDKQLMKPLLYNDIVTQDMKDIFNDSSEKAVASWVLINNKNAGVSTSTLPHAHALYLAIRKGNHIFAVVGIQMNQHETLPPYKKALLKAMLNEIALAFDSIDKEKVHKEEIIKHQIDDSLNHEDM